MSFLKFFSNEKDSEVKKNSNLHYELEKEYPHLSESEIVITACIAGLLARVAYVDFKLDDGEVLQIKEVLTKWNFCEKVKSEIVADMAVNHIQEMAGLENHLYVHPLRDLLTKEERFSVLQSLFLIAASDGIVESIESEEIRLIAKGLELSNQHFIVARAEVAEFIAALR